MMPRVSHGSPPGRSEPSASSAVTKADTTDDRRCCSSYDLTVPVQFGIVWTAAYRPTNATDLFLLAVSGETPRRVWSSAAIFLGECSRAANQPMDEIASEWCRPSVQKQVLLVSVSSGLGSVSVANAPASPTVFVRVSAFQLPPPPRLLQREVTDRWAGDGEATRGGGVESSNLDFGGVPLQIQSSGPRLVMRSAR